MSRPYTEQQVFEVEVAADRLAEMLAGHGPWTVRGIGEELLAAILYDALIALREVMIEEGDDV